MENQTLPYIYAVQPRADSRKMPAARKGDGLIRDTVQMDMVREKEIAEVKWKLNNRPRKSLGYLTPLEYFKKMFNFTSDSAVALSN